MPRIKRNANQPARLLKHPAQMILVPQAASRKGKMYFDGHRLAMRLEAGAAKAKVTTTRDQQTDSTGPDLHSNDSPMFQSVPVICRSA